MALEGSIRTFSLADIFQLIGIQRKSGVLTLRHKDEEVKVSFLNGMVVHADAKGGRLDDRLGSVLTKSGKLSEESLKIALKQQKETLKKLGNILVESGLARPDDLREALNIQITQIVYRLFRWKDGDYHFEQDASVDYDKDNFTPVSAESILMEGMRMIDEWPIIERKISSFDLVFERVPLEPGLEPTVDAGAEPAVRDGGSGDDFDLIFGGEAREKVAAPTDSIKLSREEALLYEQVNGRATVQEIIDRTMLSEFESCRALYDLSNRNLIAPVERERRERAGKRARRPDAAKWVAKVGYGVLGLWLVAALGLRLARLNPLNLLHTGPATNPAFQAFDEQLSVHRVRRLAEAIEIHLLLYQALPASAADLVSLGLIGAADLHDAWGRPIAVELRPEGYRVATWRGAADDAPTFEIDRRLP